MVKYLLESCDVSRNAFDKNDQTALHFACIQGHYHVALTLVEYYAYVEVDTPSGLQPLHLAAVWGHPTICKLLVDNNASVDAMTNSEGLAPLHCAARTGHTEVWCLN